RPARRDVHEARTAHGRAQGALRPGGGRPQPESRAARRPSLTAPTRGRFWIPGAGRQVRRSGPSTQGGSMASFKDTEQLTGKLEDLVGELRSELGNGDVDFQKVVSLADELSEQADGVAETFSSLNDTLMQGLEKVK